MPCTGAAGKSWGCRSLWPSEEQLCQKKVGQQNRQRSADHRLRRRASHSLRAARGVVATNAAGERENQAEHGSLDQAAPQIVETDKLKRVVLIDHRIRAEKF